MRFANTCRYGRVPAVDGANKPYSSNCEEPIAETCFNFLLLLAACHAPAVSVSIAGDQDLEVFLWGSCADLGKQPNRDAMQNNPAASAIQKSHTAYLRIITIQ